MAEGEKPVIVRVKRKAFQSRLDAFWLEINERPLKRPLLDFRNLSISDSSSSTTTIVEESKTKKILVHHLDTVTSSEETFDVLRSFLPNSSHNLDFNEKSEEGRRSIETVNKQDQLMFEAKQTQEILSRNTRFEQIWRNRKRNQEAPGDDSVHEMCRLYDVVQVDVEDCKIEVKKKDTDLEDCRMMAQYLPLLQEVLPTAAKEIEYDFHDCMSKQGSAESDGYVYDFYAVDKDVSVTEAGPGSLFPLVQVDDEDDLYDGPDDSECQSDDSNAENHRQNDYPDEDITDEEDEVSSHSSDDKSEVESRSSESQSEDLENGSDESSECKEPAQHNWSDDAHQRFEYEMYSDGDGDAYDHDFSDEEWS